MQSTTLINIIFQILGNKKSPKGLKVRSWCGRRDLNPHARGRQILSLVRLPIPPLLQQRYIIIQKAISSIEKCKICKVEMGVSIHFIPGSVLTSRLNTNKDQFILMLYAAYGKLDIYFVITRGFGVAKARFVVAI